MEYTYDMEYTYIETEFSPQDLADALMSKRYKRAKGYLKRDGGFCCLGVMREEVRKEGIDLKAEKNAVPGNEQALTELPEWFRAFEVRDSVTAHLFNYASRNHLQELLALVNDKCESLPDEWKVGGPEATVLGVLKAHFNVDISLERAKKVRSEVVIQTNS